MASTSSKLPKPIKLDRSDVLKFDVKSYRSSCQPVAARVRSAASKALGHTKKGWGKAGRASCPANIRAIPTCNICNLAKPLQADPRRRPNHQQMSTRLKLGSPGSTLQKPGPTRGISSNGSDHFVKCREEKHSGNRSSVLCCSKDQSGPELKNEPKGSLASQFLRLFSRDRKAAGLINGHEKRHMEETNMPEPDGPFEIQLQDVSRTYGKRTVVDGVDLFVKQGEVVGLLGPNGAGKSTTFNITVGREHPSSGSVRLNGQDITALPLDARARLGVGYLTQEPSVFRGLSVHDNLLLVLQETGVPRSVHPGRILELLTEFRLTHVRNTMGGALSGGERRRTELARALASNCSGGPPKLLLVDEPFAGVDPIGVAEIQGLLRRLCDELRMGILITDHNVTETLKICDRAYMVFDGRVMAHGSPQELVQNPFVRQYYLGEGYRHPDLDAVSEKAVDAASDSL